jgi:hypothetical protein
MFPSTVEATSPYLKQRCHTDEVSLSGSPTEDSYTFPKGTRSIAIKARTSVDIKYSWQEGGTSSGYRTIPANNEYYQEDLLLMDYRTIYLQSASSATAEIEYCQ